ncbi:MAG: hypothetical protein J0I06_11570 [Planctomycetes bacterium]|nr:hypothetical protein [Planctomycetota bacterium]
MSGSPTGQPAPGAGVAFGIVLLATIGVFGFYRLTALVPNVPAPPPKLFGPTTDEGAEPPGAFPVGREHPGAEPDQPGPADDPDPDPAEPMAP